MMRDSSKPLVSKAFRRSAREATVGEKLCCFQTRGGSR